MAGDPAKSLRINAFDVNTERYTGQQWLYQLDALGTNIGDMTAINEHELLVIERNGGTATSNLLPFKKIFRIDLNGDGSTTFTFPFVTVESALIMDANTLLVANDNNYPSTGGCVAGVSDNTEVLKIHLTSAIPEPGSYALLLAGLGGLAGLRRQRKA